MPCGVQDRYSVPCHSQRLVLLQAVDPYKERRITLGGLADHLASIKRGRRIIMVACGTSFHACLASRQCMEELAQVCSCRAA